MADLRILARKESERIKREMEELQKLIVSAPSGSLKCSKWGDGRKSYYIVKTEHGKRITKYIDRHNHELAKQLAMRDYCISKMRVLSNNLNAIDDLMNSYSRIDEHGFEMMMNPDHFELIKDIVYKADAAVGEWLDAGNEMNNNENKASYRSTHGLTQRTLCGILVRSKSEAMIADQLYLNGIPFRYESRLSFNGQEYYPDFTILHPKTLSVFVWEHFGLMSSIPYRFNAFKKLAAYSEHGLKLDKDLIATFEWDDAPLDPIYVATLIDHFFG